MDLVLEDIPDMRVPGYMKLTSDLQDWRCTAGRQVRPGGLSDAVRDNTGQEPPPHSGETPRPAPGDGRPSPPSTQGEVTKSQARRGGHLGKPQVGSRAPNLPSPYPGHEGHLEESPSRDKKARSI